MLVYSTIALNVRYDTINKNATIFAFLFEIWLSLILTTLHFSPVGMLGAQGGGLSVGSQL